MKNATTDIDRVISDLLASMTEPVAEIADAPHLRQEKICVGFKVEDCTINECKQYKTHQVAPTADNKAMFVSSLSNLVLITYPITNATGLPTQATTIACHPNSAKMLNSVAKSVKLHLMKNSPFFEVSFRLWSELQVPIGVLVIIMPKSIEKIA